MPLNILGDFFGLSTISLAIGIGIGLLSALMTSRIRLQIENPISETALIFFMGYTSYALAEVFHVSGIVTLITCGIVMAQYTWYNLSNQGKTLTACSLQVIGYGAEAFVFVYLGLTFFSYASLKWSFELFILLFFVVIVGRLAGILFLGILVKLCMGRSFKLNFKQLFFIGYCGMIRGAIAFGLVLKIDSSVANREVIVTTCLSLVIVTTILFGSTIGVL